MPQAIAAGLVYIGFSAATAAAIAAAVVNIAISVGLSFLATAFAGGGSGGARGPRPEDVQQSTRQSAQTRTRSYGRVKLSGPWVFAESKDGDFHKVIALGIGPFDAIEEFWIDDTQVTIGENDVASGGKFSDVASGKRPRIQYRLGQASESWYSTLGGFFDEWTSAHKGNGVASLYARQRALPQSKYLDLFPNGVQTVYRVVARAAKLIPFGGGTPVWGDNAANVIYDYLIHPEGLRLPAEVVNTTDALAGWSASAARAGEAVPLKAGGTEARYRIWGSYSLDERPADVLRRMLAVCDGRLKPTPDLGLTLEIGAWQEPAVTLDETAITGFSDLQRGRNVLETANTIRATFTSADLDYTTADADPWTDEEDVSARGEIANDADFIMCPSHGQARRLMKLEAYRANPEWITQLHCNLRAMAAYGDRFVRVSLAALGLDAVFEVQDFRFEIGDGDTITGLTLDVQAMPEEAYQWNAAAEEGTAPVSETTTSERAIPKPTDSGRTFDVTIERRTVQGVKVPFATASFSEPPSDALSIEFEWQQLSPFGGFPQRRFVPEGETDVSSDVLRDNFQYGFRARYITGNGKTPGAWTDQILITPIADTSPPDDVTNVSGTGGNDQATVNWKSPNSSNYVAANIYHNMANSFGGATLVRTEYGAANTAQSWTETGLSAGTHYYWVKARNASGVESATAVATGAVTVT